MKNFSFLMMMLLTIAITACQPTDSQKKDEAAKIEAAKKQYAYECHCAQAVCDKKFDIMGSNEITYEKDNVIYCFATVEAKNQFIQAVEANIKKANEVWLERAGSKDI